MKTALIWSVCVLAGLLVGCASPVQSPGTATASDARIVRGVIDSLHSPAHNFPANIPR